MSANDEKGNKVSRETDWLSALPQFEPTWQIPRIIHQTCSSIDLPPPLRDNIDRLKALNPDWEHRLYDDAARQDLIGRTYGEEVLALYRLINPAYGPARADLFRYLAIYAFGGVYIDIKSYFACPISSVVAQDDAFILSQWDNRAGGTHPRFGLHPDLVEVAGGEFQQWHVIACPGHPYLRAVIARVLGNIKTYRPWRQGVGRIGVLRLTGPIAYTKAILPLLDHYPHRKISHEAEIDLHFSIGGEYAHHTVFKQHYSRLTTSVVDLPLWAKPAALVYGRLKKWMQPAAEYL